MSQNNKQGRCQIGIIGLGTMGRNLVLNIADHGFVVAGYDRHLDKVHNLMEECQEKPVYGTTNLAEFVGLLQKPRAIMLLISAGHPVDDVIAQTLPYLQSGDLIIDAGNSHFTDTNIRAQMLQEKGIYFLGVGISGGEEGARHGPSIMPGGSHEAYERVRPILEAIAAAVDDEPCVAYMGAGSAGHYVKMVHNGIEYGIMQLIAETYDVMKRGLTLSNENIHDVFLSWSDTELESYLITITGHIFGKIDDKTGKALIDEISGVAKQTGTGMWTSQSAMDLRVPMPTIDVATAMRSLSELTTEREQANVIYNRPVNILKIDKQEFLIQLKSALYTGMIVAYAQGMALLRAASHAYAYQLDLEAVARIWRGGCIIRAGLLEDIRMAFRINRSLQNLLLDPNLSQKIMAHEEGLRHVLCYVSNIGIPAPALMASLAYLDAYRSVWLPANLIQAQRDYFGAHTYERNDVLGTFHTKWK